MDNPTENLSWLKSPHAGETIGYRDRHGNERHLNVRYPQVTATTLIDGAEIRPHLYRCSFALDGFHFCERIDLYSIIEPGEQALFIDTGHHDLSGMAFLDDLLAKTGTPWEATDIFLTHLHDDHMGNVPYCLDQGARRVMRGACKPFDPAMVTAFMNDTGVTAAGDEGLDSFVTLLTGQDNPLYEPIPAVQVVGTGTVLDRGGYHLEVLETPGHTIDHLCLLEREQRFLFAGDHIIIASPGVLQLERDQHLLRSFLGSIRELRDLGLETVYMSHHEMLEGADNIVRLLDRILGTYDKPLGKTKDILTERGPASAYEVARASCQHLPGGLAGLVNGMRARRVSTTFGYVEYLVDIGWARRHEADDGTLMYEKAN